MDISVWKITDKDDFVHVRAGAVEVSYKHSDGKGCCTLIVSGPDAMKRAEAIRDWLETESLLAD
jgi:hypothetical protein